jgi:hypothetical protein
MSALGQEQTYKMQKAMSAFASIAYVRFAPKSGHVQCKTGRPLKANSGQSDVLA